MGGDQNGIAFDHVAVGVTDPAALTPLLVGELGARPSSSGPGGEFLWWQYEFEGGGVLEVLQPDGPPGGFLHRFLDARGPGVHHATFKVPDHEVALARATGLGYDLVGVSRDFAGWKEAFLHPKQAQGIVIQIVESGPHEEDDDPDWRRPFPEAPAAGPPVELLGPLLNARDATSARRQWETLLLGRCTEHGDSLVFDWPDSPMSVVVTIDPGRAEGPIGLRISSDEPLAVPEGPHPLLGTALLPISGTAG